MNEFEQIEKYLNHTMSISERLDFEKLMEQNKNLKSQFLLQQEVNELLLDKFLLEEKQFIKDFMAQQPKSSNWKKYVGLASAVFLIVGVGAFFYEPSKKEVKKMEYPIKPINNIVQKVEKINVSIDTIHKTQNNHAIVENILPSKKQDKTNDIVEFSQDKTINNQSNKIVIYQEYEVGKDTILPEKPKIVIHQKYEIEKSTNAPFVEKKENKTSKEEKNQIEDPVYSFSESIQGGFEFTLFENQKPYYLRIISKKGEEVFAKQIENTEFWEGMNMKGQKVPQGYYIVFIEFEGEQIIKGSITILP